MKITALRDGRVTKYKVPGYLSHPVEGSHSPPPRHGLLCLCFNLFSGLSVMAVRSALTTINHFLILKKAQTGRVQGSKKMPKIRKNYGKKWKKALSRNRCKNYLVTAAGEHKFVCIANWHECSFSQYHS